jgi:hypothetical protein
LGKKTHKGAGSPQAQKDRHFQVPEHLFEDHSSHIGETQELRTTMMLTQLGVGDLSIRKKARNRFNLNVGDTDETQSQLDPNNPTDILVQPNSSPHAKSFYGGDKIGKFVKIQSPNKKSKKYSKSPAEKIPIEVDLIQSPKTNKFKKKSRSPKAKNNLSNRKIMQVSSIEVAELK